MADIAKAFVQIVPSAEGIKGKLTNLLGGEANKAGQDAGKKAGGGLVSGIKGMIVKAGIGAAIAKGITSSLNAGANLEQSIGGVETLFKNSSDKVLRAADNAYKTAGISANAYMEQVTSFSASLLQSLGGDTDKAAAAADQAIIDMSDNANKMGTSIESIQTAYQGFAKQNYTMLDNLKLGYGGTKSEMERLLKDAETLTGKKYKLDNLADVYEAIHAIQEELDITGTTSKEASTTLSGSASAMKAAFENVLGNMALGRAKLGSSVIALGQSVKTFVAGNLIPMLLNIGKSVPTVLSVALKSFGPSMLSGITSMMDTLSNAIPTMLPTLIQQGGEMVSGIISGITANLPAFASSAYNLVVTLGNGLVNSMPQLASTAASLVAQIGTFLLNNAPSILSSAGQIIVMLGLGLLSAVGSLTGAIIQLTGEMVIALFQTPWMQKGIDIMKNIAVGLGSMVGSAVQKIVSLKTRATTVFESLKTAATTRIETMKTEITTKITSLKNEFMNHVNNLKTRVTTAFATLKSKITQPVEDAKTTVNEAIEKIKSTVKGIFDGIVPKLHLSLPHVTVHGGSPPWGIMGQGQLPSFEVTWNKAAMNYAKILDGAQIFGAMGGKLLGGGEAGREVISGESHLMDLIRSAVAGVTARQMDELLYYIKQIEGNMYERLVEALKTLNIKFDDRELARLVRKYA